MVKEMGDFDLLQSSSLSGRRNDISSCIRASLDNDKTITCIKKENGALVFPKIDVNNMATIWNQLYKKEIINNYNIRFRNIQSEDELFSYEYMMYASSIKKINYQGYFFIKNPDSQGSKHNYIAEYDYILLMENIYLKILDNWSITDKKYIQKIKARIAIRITHFLLKGYLSDTRVSREVRLHRWRLANKDTFTNLRVMTWLNLKEKIIYAIAKLNMYRIMDSILIQVVEKMNR